MPSQFRATSKAMLSTSAKWVDVFESWDVDLPISSFQIAIHTSNVEKYSHVVGESVLLNLKNYLKINWPSAMSPCASHQPLLSSHLTDPLTFQMQKLGSKKRDPLYGLINWDKVTSFSAPWVTCSISWDIYCDSPNACFPAHGFLWKAASPQVTGLQQVIVWLAAELEFGKVFTMWNARESLARNYQEVVGMVMDRGQRRGFPLVEQSGSHPEF